MEGILVVSPLDPNPTYVCRSNWCMMCDAPMASDRLDWALLASLISIPPKRAFVRKRKMTGKAPHLVENGPNRGQKIDYA